MFRVPPPVLVIEKVRVVLVPKSVKLLVEVATPTGTAFPLPLSVNELEGTIVNVKVEVPVHPEEPVPVTVYTVVMVGETTRLLVVAPPGFQV